jgi:tol-pal system protein YbgF
MFRGRPALATFALVGLCFSLSARAALFDDDEARKRIEATNQRVTQVQRQLEDRIGALETQLKSQGLVELFSQVEQLKADVAKLRGQIEVLIYEQEQQQKRQRDLYVDLDSRMRKLEAGPGPGPTAAAEAPPMIAAPVPSPPPPAPVAAASNEQKAYDVALDQFKAGSYGPAIAGFNAFIKSYPKSALVPSARYWIGNAQYAQRDFRGAIATQRQMIAAHPDSPKVPDAMLSIATAQLDLGDAAAARRTLEDVVAKFPRSDAAVKAKQRLAAK